MLALARKVNESIIINNDIEVAIASAKFEHKVLMFVPVGVILMLRVMSPGYLDGIYGSFAGVILATVSLALIGVAYVLGSRITDIKV